MKPLSLIDAPLVSEYYHSGVSEMAEALQAAGLLQQLTFKHHTTLPKPDWKPVRDSETHILNPQEVRDYTTKLAAAIEQDLNQGYFPLVVGGDCTILLGSMLALKKQPDGKHGLFFVDGHADFYEAHISPSGETADMDLALAVGRGADVVTNPEGMKPLVEESNTILFGFRDEELMKAAGNPSPRDSQITCVSLDNIRYSGFSNAVEENLQKLTARVDRLWIHVDLDVLDDTEMSAVDYRMPGGLTSGELVSTLRRLIGSGKAAGLNVTIFNPTLDWDGTLAKKIVALLQAALK